MAAGGVDTRLVVKVGMKCSICDMSDSEENNSVHNIISSCSGDDKAVTGGGQGARASCKDFGPKASQTIRARIPPKVLSLFHLLFKRFTCCSTHHCITKCSGSHISFLQRATATRLRPSSRTRRILAPSSDKPDPSTNRTALGALRLWTSSSMYIYVYRV